MISFYLNGQAQQSAVGDTIESLLLKQGLAGKRIAIERNGEIVPRSAYGSTPVQPGDRIEIVTAVGGG